MQHLVGMGELLIDFIPERSGQSLKQIESFKKMAGGAPANVCACFAKLGGKSYFMGQVGDDPFGHYLKDTLHLYAVDTTYLAMTKKAKTALAFVSLDEDGDRDFIFYRDPSADQLFSSDMINYEILNHAALHFCSVGLKEYPLKKAHLEAIKYVKKQKGIISFDPNLRFALWDDEIELRKTVLSFIPLSTIVKVSEEELVFLTKTTNRYDGLNQLFIGDVEIIIVTEGSKGAWLYTKNHHYFVKAYSVDVKDTTGAGDAFIGAFLYQYLSHQHYEHDYERYLTFAQAVSAIVVSNEGAMASLPTINDVNRFLQTQEK